MSNYYLLENQLIEPINDVKYCPHVCTPENGGGVTFTGNIPNEIKADQLIRSWSGLWSVLDDDDDDDDVSIIVCNRHNLYCVEYAVKESNLNLLNFLLVLQVQYISGN